MVAAIASPLALGFTTIVCCRGMPPRSKLGASRAAGPEGVSFTQAARATANRLHMSFLEAITSSFPGQRASPQCLAGAPLRRRFHPVTEAVSRSGWAGKLCAQVERALVRRASEITLRAVTCTGTAAFGPHHPGRRAPGLTATRDRLIDLLWSETNPEAGGHSLRETMSLIGRRVGFPVVSSQHGRVTVTADIACDRTAFLDAVDSAESARAVELYGGQ